MEKYIKEFEEKQIETKAENTVSAYMSDLNHFMDYLAEQGREFKSINKEIIEQYVEVLFKRVNKNNKKKISPKTVNRHLVSIKVFIKYLNGREDYPDKMFFDIKTLKIQQNYYLEDLLTKNEFVRMVTKAEEDCDKNAVIIFKTLYYTGARVSELLAIKPSDISEDTLTIIGKGSKYREIILADDIMEALEHHINKNKIDEDDIIFSITRQTVHNLIKKYAGKCRINLKHASAHKLRHLHAIDLLSNGATLEEVADELGHKDINTTRIYTKKGKKELKKTVNRLSMNRN